MKRFFLFNVAYTALPVCLVLACLVVFCTSMVSAQGIGRPTITKIPGGLFVKWANPVELAAIQFRKGLSGPIEIMFDIPSADWLLNEFDTRDSSALSPESITALTDYWIVRGKPEKAIPLYKDALENGNLDERRTLLFKNNLAMLLSQSLGQHDEALELINRALDIQKDNVTLLDSKGLILINSGNPEEAVPPLQRAVELSCQHHFYCMHLAYALHLQGRPSQARRYFDIARDQLSGLDMSKENAAMFDTLQTSLPPIGGL